MNKEETLKIKRYCQSVIDKPRSFEEQPNVAVDGHIWCRDWEIIEVCKFLFNGKDAYLLDPPPNRLRNNILFKKESIVKVGEAILHRFRTADDIISALKGWRDGKNGTPWE